MSLVEQITAMHIYNPHSGFDATEDEVNQYLVEIEGSGEQATVDGFKAWLYA